MSSHAFQLVTFSRLSAFSREVAKLTVEHLLISSWSNVKSCLSNKRCVCLLPLNAILS